MNIDEKVDKVEKEVQEVSFAMEMLKEMKKQNKRQHITIIILISVIVAMIIGFLLYESQFETVDKSTILNSGNNGKATYFENTRGDISYGIHN